MVILDVSSPVLGRFRILDDLTIDEVLFLPHVTEEEVAGIEAMLRLKDTTSSPKLHVLFATLGSLYGLSPADLEVHLNAEVFIPEGEPVPPPDPVTQ